MCGIAGILAYRGDAPPVDREELLRIRDHMIRRGPDGAGLWISNDSKVGLAHRRLAIIDLSEAGAQPMATADGRYRITYNGEVYNYRELRKELEAKGYVFRSNSDTEVLLHLYADRGQQMVHALRGMFAFGIWDEREKSLFLARDPFGIKPLYYADDGKTFRFASQVKALMKSGHVDSAPEAAGAVGFFLWGAVPEPYTLYRGIRALSAGSYMTLVHGRSRDHRQFLRVREVLADAECRAQAGCGTEPQPVLREALFDSVKCHLESDVPVGVFLSSGFDSSVLAALIREVAGPVEVRTLTLGFREFAGTANDETPLAERVAARYGTAHETHWITRNDFDEEFDRILEAMDQPSIDGVNTYFVSRAAAQAGLKVAISGLGGDELLGGYSTFRGVPRLVRALRVPAALPVLGRLVRTAMAHWIGRVASPKYAGLLEYGGTWAGAYLLSRAMYMPWELEQVLDPATTERGLSELATLEALRHSVERVRGDWYKVAALEVEWYLRNQLLRDSDWAGMAHSIEVRVPFVDLGVYRRVAPYFASPRRPSKSDLGATAQPALPREIIERKKTGFGTPVREWTRDRCAGGLVTRHLTGWARLVYRHQLEART